MIEGFFDGYKNQSLREKNRALEEKDEAIERWAAREEELMRKVRELEAALQARDAEIKIRKIHYLGLEAERDAILSELDDCSGGPGKNPLRQPAYQDTDFVIENGPRKGQKPQLRDHYYFSKVADLIFSRAPELGSWKKLIREWRIHD
ncbi:hypothetical protein [Palleronia sp.]|uniref:hypothetical protein n=1 Tax=Palleronia sp. TaxID=1940284 RepID=UPI0035C849B2